MTPARTCDSALRNVAQILTALLDTQPGASLTLPRHVVEYVLSGVEIARLLRGRSWPSWAIPMLVGAGMAIGFALGHGWCP